MKTTLGTCLLLAGAICAGSASFALAQDVSDEWLADISLPEEVSVADMSLPEESSLAEVVLAEEVSLADVVLAEEVSLADVVDASHLSAGDWGGYDDAGFVCAGGPTWNLAANAVFMQRGRPDSLVLMQDAAAPARNLNANAFDFDFQTGWDVSLERDTGTASLEARLLSIDGWDSSATGIVGAPTLVRINTMVPTFLPGVTAVNANYNSELFSGELNLRTVMTDRVRLLAGFRYLELDEQFRAGLDAAVLPSTYDVATQNRLYGGQVGVDALLWCRGRLTVEGLAKVGAYHNSANQNTILDTGAVTVTAAESRNRTAFSGELTFTANYSLSDQLTLRAGYDLLWLETVALATDQIPNTHFFTGRGMTADGGAFYHGGFVGLEYRR